MAATGKEEPLTSSQVPARKSRRSEPTHPSALASSARVHLHHRGGWEYPLSKEEKKQRVIHLFEAELAEDENTIEALQALLEKRGAPSSPRKAPRAPVNDTTTTVATSSLVDKNRSQKRFESFGLGLVLGGLVVLLLAWLGAPSVSIAKHSNGTSLNDWIASSSTIPPNLTDRVLGMRHQGHIRLKLSNCAEAEWWFSSALQLMSVASNVSDAQRRHTVGEQGFALVCSQQFKEGAKLLEQHLAPFGFRRHPHLLNALGFAHYRMQDFTKAAEFFEHAIKADETNHVPWINIAAAKLMGGDTIVAEQAMSRANYLLMGSVFRQDPFYRQMLEYNFWVLGEITSDPSKASTMVAWVDLWNGYHEFD